MIIFSDGMISFGLEFSCEVSHPIPPNNVSGVVLSYSHLISTLMLVAGSYIVKDPNNHSFSLNESKKRSLIMWKLILLGLIASFICSFFAKEDLRKTKIDLEENDVTTEVEMESFQILKSNRN